MKIVIDLDGTICEQKPTFERSLAKPLEYAKETMQRLKDQGHYIIIYTGRGWLEQSMTEKWLKDNGIPYDQILFGKPYYDIWIDDRAFTFKDWEDVEDMLEIFREDKKRKD